MKYIPLFEEFIQKNAKLRHNEEVLYSDDVIDVTVWDRSDIQNGIIYTITSKEPIPGSETTPKTTPKAWYDTDNNQIEMFIIGRNLTIQHLPLQARKEIGYGENMWDVMEKWWGESINAARDIIEEDCLKRTGRTFNDFIMSY